MFEDELISGDGTCLHMRTWRATPSPRAVLVICHGLNSHSGQYDWVARRLTGQGLEVMALDLRGRGMSDGERFFVEDIASYVSDLRALITKAREHRPGLPIYLLGHSAGGVVSCSYCLDYQDEIDGLICESFAYQVPAPGLVLSAIKGISHLAPKLGVLTLKMKDFTRDPQVLKTLERDPLTLNETQPAATVAALVRADERLHVSFDQITLPVLILHGTADRATSWQGSQFFHDNAGSQDKTLKLYEGHFHDLLADLGREAVLEEIARWIDARLPAPRARASDTMEGATVL